MVPADDQAMVLPCASVMVMVVLLNDELTCAMPEAMFLRSRRRTRVASLPILNLSCDLKRRRNASGYTCAANDRSPLVISLLLLLSGDRLGRAPPGARVGVGTRAAHREAAAMAQAAIAAEIHQTLDVDAGLATQIAFDQIVAVDHFAYLQHFLVAQLRHAAIIGNLDLLQDVGRILLADAMDVLERDQDALVGRNIHAGNTGHGLLSCRRSLADRLFLAISGRCPQTRTRRPSPWFSRGPASSENYPTGYRAY